MTGQRMRLIPLLVITVLLFPSLARPDGGLYIGDVPLAPREQAAAIVHRDGVERMVIALNFDAEDNDSALWIFPVPGIPSQTKVEIVDSFPRFFGTDPRALAWRRIDLFMYLPPETQIWPIPLLPWLYRSNIGAGGGISVSGEVEKWGLHAEIISAKNVDGLAVYLREKKGGVEPERLRAFEPYLGGGYVLVAAWISSRSEVLKSFPQSRDSFQRLGGVRRPALYVEFPTETAYFPLRPTAMYGEVYIPVRLFIGGYVEPRTNSMLTGSLVLYYHQGGLRPYIPGEMPPQMRPQEALQAFRNALGPEPVEFTAVRLEMPARNFTDDLRFVPTQPPGMRFAHLLLGGKPLLVFVLVFAGLSYLSAGLAGLLVRRQWHRCALFGLFNLLTIFGFGIGVTLLRRREGKEFRGFRFLVAFTTTFVLLSSMLQLPLWLLIESVGPFSLFYWELFGLGYSPGSWAGFVPVGTFSLYWEHFGLLIVTSLVALGLFYVLAEVLFPLPRP